MQLTDFINADTSLPIKGVTSDSRQVREGYLFAALPGSKVKGSEFIADAVRHGATYILADKEANLPIDMPEHVRVIIVENTREAFARIAAKFYKLQPATTVAVTGTSGKTSVVSFVQQIWHLSGITKCASLGTLGVRGPGVRRYGSLTTPDTQALHAELADLASVGIEHLAMEASSHGLDQYRLDGVKIKAAAYTNLSRDHMDYHTDMDEYFEAKARLFSELVETDGAAIINMDDEYAMRLIDKCKARNIDVLTYGYKADDLKIVKRTPKPDGQDIELSVAGKSYELTLPLVGEFQVLNALCALGLVLSQDNNPDKYIPILEELRGVPGRLQLVGDHPKGAVYVDYAHKPAALEAVLSTLRPHTENNLVCVFGCGGNRDVGKRGLMGGIANKLADKVIVTDDNPRHEDPTGIRAQILEEVPKAIEVADRAQAIHKAVQELNEGDVLIVAGKGHETGQIVADKVHPFDDVEEVKKALEKL